MEEYVDRKQIVKKAGELTKEMVVSSSAQLLDPETIPTMLTTTQFDILMIMLKNAQPMSTKQIERILQLAYLFDFAHTHYYKVYADATKKEKESENDEANELFVGDEPRRFVKPGRKLQLPDFRKEYANKVVNGVADPLLRRFLKLFYAKDWDGMKQFISYESSEDYLLEGKRKEGVLKPEEKRLKLNAAVNKVANYQIPYNKKVVSDLVMLSAYCLVWQNDLAELYKAIPKPTNPEKATKKKKADSLWNITTPFYKSWYAKSIDFGRWFYERINAPADKHYMQMQDELLKTPPILFDYYLVSIEYYKGFKHVSKYVASYKYLEACSLQQG